MNSNELRALVKECVLEVLQESLLEGFDPVIVNKSHKKKRKPNKK